MSLPFRQVDVFTKVAFKGNPVAVFFNADDLTTEQMQEIARWTNLSETTFVLKPTEPEADYQLRIFTPEEEFPFAGHPTIGSVHAIIESGLVPKKDKYIQQCKAGLVDITLKDDVLQFKLPYHIHKESSHSLNQIYEVFGLSEKDIKYISLVDDGPQWLTIHLSSGELVSSLKPDFSKAKTPHDYSFFGKSEDGTYEARNFFPVGTSYIEDPVCGSGAAANASVLAASQGFEGDLTFRQGRNIGRNGYLQVKVVKNTETGENDIYVGGNAVTVIEGVYRI